jgi:hypothetical protein
MNYRDDDLQNYIAQLEMDKAPQTVLAELPVEDKELAPMLAIAAALRELPDPEIDPVEARAQDRKVLMAIRWQAAQAAPNPSNNGHYPVQSRKFTRFPSLNVSRPYGLVGGLAVVLLVSIVFLLVARFVPPVGLDHSRATLADVAGVVEITSDQVAWQEAQSGDVLTAGQRIRTGPGSTATLVFFDGTKTRLAAETDLTLSILDGEDDSLRVELDQNQGRTRHDVVPLKGDEAFYRVRTPGGSAVVHGTVFDVRVSEEGAAEFDVTEGQVAVNAAGQEVLLGPGQMTTAAADTPPAAPTTSSQPHPNLSFIPDQISGSGCTNTFTVIAYLENVATDPEDEAVNVSLGYNVIEGSEYVESISLIPSGWPLITAGGSESFFIMLAMNANWQSAPDATEVKVRVFVAHEDNWPEHHVAQLTVTITRLCEMPLTPTATTTATSIGTTTPTSTPSPTPTGTVTAIATITATITATPSPTVTGTPMATPPSPVATDCTGADPHPQGTTLAARFGVPYEEIMGWFCSGYGFGEIEHAYEISLTAGVPVADIFAMRAAGLGWGQIEQQLGLKSGGGPSESTSTPEGAGPPDDAGPPPWAGPPDNPGNPNKPDKPDKPEKPGKGGKP